MSSWPCKSWKKFWRSTCMLAYHYMRTEILDNQKFDYLKKQELFMKTCKLQLFKYFIFKSKGWTYDFIINCVYFLNGKMRLQVQQSIILDEYKRAVLNFANSPFNYMAWFVFPQSISSSFSCFFSYILILISNLGTFKWDISWSLHITEINNTKVLASDLLNFDI